MTRLERRVVLVGGLLAGAGALLGAVGGRGQDKHPQPAAGIETIEIDAWPIAHFERERPETKRFGPLEFRGGLELSSASASFGGWSGLVMEPDGRRLLAISDVGTWMTAELAYDGQRPVGLANARLGPILDSRGRPLKRKADADAEAVALLEGNLQDGMMLIGFERNHRVMRYPLRAGVIQPAAGALSLPDEGRRMPANQGIEAVTVVQGGRYDGAVVAFAERFLRGGHHTGWIWIGKEAQHLALKDIDGFNVTDAAGLPDGSLLVLERYFRVTEGVKMRLRHIDAGEIEPGALMIGRILVEAAGASHVIDNMEGLAVHRDGGGETVLTVIADDNFQPLLQRTVLLQFAFRDQRTGIQPPSRT